MDSWNTVAGHEAMNALCQLPSKLELIAKELKRANDLKTLELQSQGVRVDEPRMEGVE